MNHFMENDCTLKKVSLSNDNETCSERARPARKSRVSNVFTNDEQKTNKYERRIDLTNTMMKQSSIPCGSRNASASPESC